MAQKFPEELLSFISYLKKLPGVGTRTAERFAFEFLSWSQEELASLGTLFQEIRQKLPPCKVCGCLTQKGNCAFCDLQLRDSSKLCLLSSPRDAYAIEETRAYQGLYHVVEHLLSPLEGRHAHLLRLDRIEERIAKSDMHELILAFDSTLEGDATALYIKRHFASSPLKISRLAFGLPLGSTLETIDGGTLSRALEGRQTF